MSATVEHVRFGDSRLGGLIEGARSGNTLLWRTVVAMAMGSVLMFALQFVDARLINGVNIWDKPAKFFLSLAVQYGTVSWALSLLPLADRATRWVRWPVVLMLIAGWGEMAYMIFRASRGEASHFNTSSFGAALGYSLMGVGAVTLTVTAAIIGWIIWRRREGSIWKEAAGLGLMVGSLLGTIAGAYMSAQTSHLVGGVASDAGGLAFFNWSVTGGDLRVAHFVGLHAAQFIPLAALSGDRRVVYGVAFAMVLFTTAIFMMGVSGVPLFRA